MSSSRNFLAIELWPSIAVEAEAVTTSYHEAVERFVSYLNGRAIASYSAHSDKGCYEDGAPLVVDRKSAV